MTLAVVVIAATIAVIATSVDRTPERTVDQRATLDTVSGTLANTPTELRG
jgi:hypothetical protein